jgi:hypothetical protein
VEAVTFTFDPEGCNFTLRDDRGEHRIRGGNGVWCKGVTTLDTRGQQLVAASGAWADENSYVLKFYYYTTPFCPTIRAQFVDDQLLLDYEINLAFGPAKLPQLVGHTQ